uniref:phospholipase effector Tle1 domain-containing protein n=1 Tax=Flavobacterium sp. TaxID=239 RepID=UPI004047E003
MEEEKNYAKITYIGGNYIENINGKKITYAKKHGVISDKKIVQTAKNGILYKEPQSPPAILPATTTIKVSLNLFFDGTQNNQTNTEQKTKKTDAYKKVGNKKNDSYENDFSNVARGYNAVNPNAENQVSKYIEGIGTVDEDSDYISKGVILGEGETGVKAKVAKGCVEGAKGLSAYAGKDIELVVNVFGFSRGAAAARHFLHVATNAAQTKKSKKEGFVIAMPPSKYLDRDKNKNETVTQNPEIEIKENHALLAYGYFGACLFHNKIIPKKVVFKFAGLYDTVASFGVDHRGGWTVDNDTVQLGLDAVKKVNFVLHLAAVDEHRDNFDLTNINSAGLNGLQMNLPGVHSDIGGCYVNNQVENIILLALYAEKFCKTFASIIENDGWYAKNQLAIKKETKTLYNLIGTRTLHNTYDKIALETVIHYSKETAGVEYLTDQLLNLSVKRTNDAFLIGVNTQLTAYKNACNELRNQYVRKETNDNNYLLRLRQIDYRKYINPEDLKKLRNRYFHWSAQQSMGLKPRINYPATE